MGAAPLSPFIVIRGAGEMASAIAWRLFMANMTRICMLELPNPLCVRREVSFCTAFDRGEMPVEGVRAAVARNREEMEAAWQKDAIALMRIGNWEKAGAPPPEVVVDAILAKKNIATSLADAPLVIALGPGFAAGKDCHVVIETNRGHNLGRIILDGEAAPNTGIPGNIAGHTATRVLRAPASGIFESEREIGDSIAAGQSVGTVAGQAVIAGLDGMLRGLIRPGTEVASGLKLGDIDPRGEREFCYTISDKARALSGSVLEAVMRFHNGACTDRETVRH